MRQSRTTSFTMIRSPQYMQQLQWYKDIQAVHYSVFTMYLVANAE